MTEKGGMTGKGGGKGAGLRCVCPEAESFYFYAYTREILTLHLFEAWRRINEDFSNYRTFSLTCPVYKAVLVFEDGQ
jgi:hypothetical protein